MKKFIIFFITAISLTSLNADSVKSINLTEECSGSVCKPRIWWAIDSYSEKFLEGKTDDSGWKEIQEFPVWMNKFFSNEGTLKVYSLITKFDYPPN